MATTQSSENVSLKSSKDWEAWNTQFEFKAISTDLWRLISPNEDEEGTEPFAEKPSPPNIGDYDKRLTRQEARETRENRLQNAQCSTTAQASQQQQQAGVPEMIPVEEVDTANKPKTVAEMTTAARQAFQLDWTIYQHDLKIYTAEREAIDELKNWVVRTTSKHLVRTACDPKDTLKGWYENLKEQVGVSIIKQKKNARSIYKEATKPLTKAPRDALAWLTNWEQAVTLAKEKEVPEVQDSNIWFEDFSLAIRGFMKEWIVLYEMIHATEIEEGTLTFRKLASDLRKELLRS
jgi:hypothetical protein